MEHPNTAPQMPAGMVAVSKEQFFAALNADPRDIMPHLTNPRFSTWETKSRQVWGWTAPGWQNPRDEKIYAIFPSAIVAQKAA